MKIANATMAIATVRMRSRRPAVIIAIQSRHASRNSCCANQVSVPGWVIISSILARDYSFPSPACGGG